MLKYITTALLALFLFQVDAQTTARTTAAMPEATKTEASPAQEPRFYRPTGCDTLLTTPTETFFCTCNCVAFNPSWITDSDPKSIGLNLKNLASTFDIQVPPEIFECGKLIGLDSDGVLFYAMFSAPVEGGIVTTRFTWRYMCRSGAFFLEDVTRKGYKK